MAICIAALRAMVAAGISAQQLVDAIEADYALSAGKRKKDAERKRASRMSTNVQRTSTDIADATQAIAVSAIQKTLDFVPPPQNENTECKNSASISLSSSSTSLNLEEGKKERSEVTRARDRKSRATRLPEDWTASDNDLAFAQSWMKPESIAIELDKFRDHWRAANGPPSIKNDWSAAWRNWCRKSPQFNRAHNGQHRQGSGVGSGNGASTFATRAVASAKRRAAAAFGPDG